MMVNKPITIARQDFIDSIVDLCNNANLPYFCIESVLKDVLSEVHQACAKQLEMDKKKYEAELRKVSEGDIIEGQKEE